MRKLRQVGIGTALAMAGCVALGAGAFAIASDDGDSGRTTVEQAERGFIPGGIPRRPELHFRRPHFERIQAKDVLARREDFAKQLGAELDKSSDDVLAALRAVFKKHIDEAVEDEDLTQKQADRILDCYDSAKCGPLGFGAAHFEFHGAPPPGLPGPPSMP